MEKGLDFDGLKNRLQSRIRSLLPTWLPGGKLNGKHYVCSNIHGGNGESLKVELSDGSWRDWATGDGGGDLIALYASIQGIGQGDAYKRLAEDFGHDVRNETPAPKPDPTPVAPPAEEVISKPPIGLPVPTMWLAKLGDPTRYWTYTDAAGETLFYVARYDPPEGKKQFRPWAWSGTRGRFQSFKAYPAPRPLYGLHELTLNPAARVLLVEGEKAADAARSILGMAYVVVTWPGGAQAISQVDWTPLYGRALLLWPDADPSGIAAMQAIAEILNPHCPEVKIINVDDLPPKSDAADWVNERTPIDADDVIDEPNWNSFKAWATPRARPFISQTAAALVPPTEVLSYEGTEAELAPQPNEDGPEATPEERVSLNALGVECAKSSGLPFCNASNVLQVLSNYGPFKDLVWYDKFYGRYFTKWMSDARREWRDRDDGRIMMFLQKRLAFHKIAENHVSAAIREFAEQHAKNEPLDWMNSLKWDGHSRVETFFHACLGVADTPYSRAVSRNFWVSMAARVNRPGCKADAMVILEGKQGTFKSTALATIGGPWYAEVKEPPSSKDFYLTIQGKLLVEIGELDSFSKADVTTIKIALSTATDRFRPPYGRAPQDFPRQCIFTGTTNEAEYLKDSTGARRFWPLSVGTIDIESIRINRDQLFAEALHLYCQGATWHEVPIDEAEAEQEARRQVDVWEDVVQDWLLGRSQVCLTEVATDALKIDIGRIDRLLQHRLSKIMRTLGWSKKTARHGLQGTLRKVWCRLDDMAGPLRPAHGVETETDVDRDPSSDN